MSSNSKLSTSIISSCESDAETTFSFERSNSINSMNSMNSFLNEKDIAMSSIELDDESFESSSFESLDSPRFERVNTNVFIISSRSQNGVQITDSMIYDAISSPVIIRDD